MKDQKNKGKPKRFLLKENENLVKAGLTKSKPKYNPVKINKTSVPKKLDLKPEIISVPIISNADKNKLINKNVIPLKGMDITKNTREFTKRTDDVKKRIVNEKACPVYKKCGGCQLQNLTYEDQLSWKQGLCIRNLGKFAHVEKIIGMEKPYNYRNKVQAAFCTEKGGKVISGIYQSSTHKIVSVNKCMTEDENADRIIVSIRKLIKAFKLSTYDEITGKGFLRHVLVKKGFATGQIMVVLVCGTPVFTAKHNFIRELLKLHPEITTIVMNINNKHTSMILGHNEKVLFGKGTIEDVLCGCKFRISPKSFYQINSVQTEILYNIAMEYAQLNGSQLVLDAYCGIGTIGIIASKSATQVLGVEVNPDAVKDAISNVRENGLKNIKLICADAGDVMTEMAKLGEKCDVVFMDPPRSGSDAKFLKSLCTLGAKIVVYISCNPETLARDLEYLCKNGYRVNKIQPVDMFPHTNHVETVVLLSLKSGTPK